jgi:hypothetical protein
MPACFCTLPNDKAGRQRRFFIRFSPKWCNVIYQLRVGAQIFIFDTGSLPLKFGNKKHQEIP